MPRISIKSAKNKGRRLQNTVRDLLLECTNKSGLINDDIRCAIGGENGVDIKLSPLAQQIIPFDCECKNCEKLSVFSAMKQAISNSSPDRVPLVIFKKNRTDMYCMISEKHFINIVKFIDDRFNIFVVNSKRINIWNIISNTDQTVENTIIHIKSQFENYYILKFKFLLKIIF